MASFDTFNCMSPSLSFKLTFMAVNKYIASISRDSLKVIERLIKAQQMLEALQLLSKIPTKKAPEETTIELASLARRAGNPKLALEKLKFLIQEVNEKKRKPTPSLLLEWGAALINLRAAQAGIKKLEKVNSTLHPKALLYLAFGYFSKWDYETSLPLLYHYIELEMDPYWRSIGKLNLCAAQLFCNEPEKALAGIHSLFLDPRFSKNKIVRLNLNELFLQSQIRLGDFCSAHRLLQKVQREGFSKNNLFSLFYEKWAWILKLQESGYTNSVKTTQQQLARKALTLKHDETLRDLDFWQAKITKKEDLISKLWFGTPHSAFKKRIEREMSFTPPLHWNYVLKPKENGQQSEFSLDLASATLAKNAVQYDLGFSQNSLSHRLLIELSNDLYAPKSLLEIYDSLFSGEVYSSINGPTRFHQALFRLRSALKNCGQPLEVCVKNQNYSLTSKAPLQLIYSTQMPRSKNQSSIEILKTSFQNSPFKRNEAQKVLKTSERTTNRILKAAIEMGALKTFGKTSKTQYQIER